MGRRGRYSGPMSINDVKAKNAVFVEPGDNLQSKYDWLKSSDRDGAMGALSATNQRTLMVAPGNYDDSSLAMDTDYVNVVGIAEGEGVVVFDNEPTITADHYVASGIVCTDTGRFFAGETLVEKNAMTPVLQPHTANSSGKMRVLWHDGATLYAAHQAESGTLEGTIYKSTNSGDSWTPLTEKVGAVTPLFMLVGQATGTLIVIADDKHIYRSDDDGATAWTDEHTLDHLILSTSLTETSNGTFVLGEYAITHPSTYEIFTSVDDGLTWVSKLASVSGDATASDQGHVHCVQWDKHANKLVAMLDYPYPKWYTSVDHGENWVLLATTTGDQPNCLNLMFDDNYIGWAYDCHAYSGKVARMSRTAFYSGSWSGEVEQVAETNAKMGYYASEISDNFFVFSQATEYDSGISGHPGNWSNDLIIVYDDLSSVAMGMQHQVPLQEIAKSTSKKAFFANRPYDGSGLDGILWTNFEHTALPYAYFSCPISLAVGFGPQIRNHIAGTLIIGEDCVQRIGPVNASTQFLSFDSTNNRVNYWHTSASLPIEMRWYDNGDIGFITNGIRQLFFNNDASAANMYIELLKRVRMPGLLTGATQAAAGAAAGELWADSDDDNTIKLGV